MTSRTLVADQAAQDEPAQRLQTVHDIPSRQLPGLVTPQNREHQRVPCGDIELRSLARAVSISGRSALSRPRTTSELRGFRAEIGTRRALNLIKSTNITLTVADNSGNDRVSVTVAAAGGGNRAQLALRDASRHGECRAGPGRSSRRERDALLARRAGNTTAARLFLRQTGTGTVSALPATSRAPQA
jgi:hypothetical protein